MKRKEKHDLMCLTSYLLILSFKISFQAITVYCKNKPFTM